MKIARFMISLVSFCIALIIGYRSGTQINLFELLIKYSLDHSPTHIFPKNNDNQINLLIIGTSDHPEGQLESIWLAAYSEITQNITFMPIFPSPSHSEQNQLLADAFSLEKGKPSQVFWETLQGTHKLWWKGYILSDRVAAIDIVNSLDGIYVKEILLNGDQAVNHIFSWQDNSQLAIEQQRMLLEGICNRLVETHPLESSESWKLIFQKPIDTDLQTIFQVTSWISKFRKNGDVTCEFPSPVMPQAILNNH
jgi:hypothetical protein